MTSENTRKQTGRKNPSSAWRPGHSGNPGGRPKVSAEIRNLAREHGPKALSDLSPSCIHGMRALRFAPRRRSWIEDMVAQCKEWSSENRKRPLTIR